MERALPLSVFVALAILGFSHPALAGMYKWYDDQGKVNYTQTPPPKGSRMAPINTDTYNTVKMSDVSKVTPRAQVNSVRPSTQNRPVERRIAPQRTVRRRCPLSRRR
ncbi:MAG: DUF4124 domain-containing protein [Candidatus Thiodiazotropha sp.]